MAANFENMGYEAVPETFLGEKMAAGLDERVPEALQPIAMLKMGADFENMC